MNNLYILCGASFSGKTTLAGFLIQKCDAIYISLDDINLERGLDPNQNIPIPEWEKTHQIALLLIKILAKTGQDIIIDDTNLLKKLRDRYSKRANDVGYTSKVIYVDTSEAILINRFEENKQKNSRHLPPQTDFLDVIKHFEIPTAEENVIIYQDQENYDQWYQNNFEK